MNPETKQLQFYEIKTGDDPQYTAAQRQIYPLAMIGGHVYTDDPRIIKFGYSPKQLLPPMSGWEMYVPGPGKKVQIKPLEPEFE